MKCRAYAVLTAVVLLASCGSFIRTKDIPLLQKYGEKEYVLKQDVSQGEVTLKKGQRVKLHVITGAEMVKIYCYAADIDVLKAERVLVLYLFEDDFPAKVFDIGIFEEKLYAILE